MFTSRGFRTVVDHGPRDFYREWRGFHIGGDRLAPGEYSVGGGGQIGPLSFFFTTCTCGERSVRAFLSLPTRRTMVRRVHAYWCNGERPSVGFDHFLRP